MNNKGAVMKTAIEKALQVVKETIEKGGGDSKPKKKVKKTKAEKVARESKDLTKTLGKMVMDLRKAVAGMLGDVSRHTDEITVLKRTVEELKKKQKRLETDPLYTVPQRLQKEVEQHKASATLELVKLRTRVTKLESKKGGLDTAVLSRTTSQLAALEQKVAKIGQIEIKTQIVSAPAGTVENFELRFEALESAVGALEDQLTSPAPIDIPTATVVNNQLTLEGAIEKSKSEGGGNHA